MHAHSRHAHALYARVALALVVHTYTAHAYSMVTCMHVAHVVNKLVLCIFSSMPDLI